MPDADVVSTITLRIVSDITEQLTRDEAAITSFAARVDALKASNLGAITAPSAGGSSATYAESLVASNGAARVATNGSAAYTSALEKEIAVTIAVADAHEAEAAKVIASSERIMATSQGRVAQVARTLTVEKAAADAGVSSNSLLGREFLRLGDTANIAGAKLRVFDSLGIGLAGNITLLGAAITALSVKDFADFQQKMQQLGANTGLTRTQISSLTGTIIQMGTTTPTSLAELADGFRHILSEGYGLRDSVLVAKAALDAADATGASFADTASTVATEMHNWGDSASKAAQDTGALLVAAQRGNTDLQGLVGALSKVGVEMSSIHQPMADAVSIVSEFSRATGDPAIAGTWAAAMIAHIINPTKQAITVMGELKTTTGVDLQKAFAQFSAGQINFTTLMQEAQQATHGNAQEIMALFGGLRGGLGALQLLHGGLQQYIDTQAKASDGAAELAKHAAAAHDNLLFKFGVAVNIVKIATVDFGGVINTVIDDLGGLIAKFDSLPGPLKSAVSLMAGAFNPFVAAGTAAIGVVDLVRGATDKHTESIKQQIAALQKEKVSLENTTTSNQGYRLGAENSELATRKLADVTQKIADLQHLAAQRADEHTAALNRQALTIQSLTKLAFWGPQPTVYIPPKDSDIAGMIASAQQRVTTDTNRLAYDRQYHPTSVAGDEAELAKAKAALAKWDDALGKSASGVDAWTSRYQAAQKNYTDALDRVRLDIADPKRHGDLAAAREEEARAAAALKPFNDAIKDTTASTKVHKTSLDALQRVQADLSKAEQAVYADIAAGRPITADQKKRIIEDTAEIKKMTDAVSHLTGKLKGPSAAADARAGKDLASILGISTMGPDMVKALLAQAKQPIVTFADSLKAAQQTAADWADAVAQKMYDLQHHISDDLPPLAELEKGARAAAQKAQDMADKTAAAAAALAKIPDIIAKLVTWASGTAPSAIGRPPTITDIQGGLTTGALGSQPGPAAAPKSLDTFTFAVFHAADALQARLGYATGQAAEAVANLTIKYHDHATVTVEDIAAARAGFESTKAWTQAQWDANFAAGDAATKSQMLSAAFSGLISQASTIAGAQAAVDNAKLGVIAAESAVQVQLLQSEVTATQDLGGIITAQAGIQKAISDGQISAINDSTTIMQSSYGVEVAQAAVSQALLTGNSLTIAIANAGLKVAQDTLQIDHVTAEMDAANARWSIRLAEDQARLAMDKLLTDNANSAATARVLMDHLAVAKDAVDIALAQQKLTLDTMVILANIDSTLGGVTDYRALITGDLAGLDKAQKQSTADQYKEAYDQANANQIATQGGLTLAGDQNSLNSDQASAASVSQAFLLQLAELKKIAAGDTISQQRLQAMEASLSTIAKDAGTIAASAKASEELLERIRELNNRGLEGLQRIDVTGSSTASMTNGLGAQMAQNPTHG